MPVANRTARNPRLVRAPARFTQIAICFGTYLACRPAAPPRTPEKDTEARHGKEVEGSSDEVMEEEDDDFHYTGAAAAAGGSGAGEYRTLRRSRCSSSTKETIRGVGSPGRRSAGDAKGKDFHAAAAAVFEEMKGNIGLDAAQKRSAGRPRNAAAAPVAATATPVVKRGPGRPPKAAAAAASGAVKRGAGRPPKAAAVQTTITTHFKRAGKAAAGGDAVITRSGNGKKFLNLNSRF